MSRGGRNAILILSQEFDPHVDWVVGQFQRANVRCIRWPTSHFPLQSALHYRIVAGSVEGTIEVDGKAVDLCEIRSVWFVRTAAFVLPPDLPPQEKRFAQSEASRAFYGLLRIGDWFWVNHPDKERIAACKPLQLKIAQELGFAVPRTLVTNDPAQVREFFAQCDGQIVYKAFESGFFLTADRACYTTPVTRKHLEKADLIRTSGGIFQEKIPKHVDLRITVIGRRVFAVEIHSQDHSSSRHDWRAGKVASLRHCRHRLPPRIESLCLRFLERFGLVYGAIDMILTRDGRYLFLENNPCGQFGWIEGRTGLPMTSALAEMLIAGRVL